MPLEDGEEVKGILVAFLLLASFACFVSAIGVLYLEAVSLGTMRQVMLCNVN